MTTESSRKRKPRVSMLNAQALRELLRYESATGIFYWRNAVCNRPAGAKAGTTGKIGYVDICVLKERHGAHRLAWLYVYGEWPKPEVDHVNGVRSDNRIENLRDVTHAVNTQNLRSAHRRNTSSGLLGVRKAKDSHGYQANIHVNGKNHRIGRFATAEEAHAAYLNAKRKLHAGCSL